MADGNQRVSKVFGERLRLLREERGWSAAQLAQRMRAAGFPRISKAAVLRVEANTRKVTLDEGLAFAMVLNAVPAQLLSPTDGEYVALTDQIGLDGAGMRGWLRFGLASIADAGDLPPERVEDLRLRGIAILARAYLDAVVSKDEAGKRDALSAMARIFTTPGKTPAELGVGSASITLSTSEEEQ